MNKKIVISFLVVFVFVSLLLNVPSKKTDIKYVNIGGQKITVELATTVTEQEKGLSGRTNLNENTGMLFVFNKLGVYPFWMKDMNFPIDMIWLAPIEGGDGSEVKIVYIKKNATPDSYPQSFGTIVPAKYVLEARAGFSEANHLEVGDSASFTY